MKGSKTSRVATTGSGPRRAEAVARERGQLPACLRARPCRQGHESGVFISRIIRACRVLKLRFRTLFMSAWDGIIRGLIALEAAVRFYNIKRADGTLLAAIALPRSGLTAVIGCKESVRS